MLVVFFRAIFLYILVTFSLRLMGKRQLGELQPSELVTTILISNIASLPIEDTSIPMILGMIPVMVLVGFEILLSNCALQSKRFRSFLSGSPIVIIHGGVLDQTQLRKLRFSIDDLMESLRQDGIFDLREVEYAIVETTGKVSVLQKFSAQTVTPQMLNLPENETEPPCVLVSDGQLVHSAVAACRLDISWVLEVLKKEGLTLRQTFLLSATPSRNYYLIPKAEKGAVLPQPKEGVLI